MKRIAIFIIILVGFLSIKKCAFDKNNTNIIETEYSDEVIEESESLVIKENNSIIDNSTNIIENKKESSSEQLKDFNPPNSTDMSNPETKAIESSQIDPNLNTGINYLDKDNLSADTLVSCQTQIQYCEPKESHQYDEPEATTFCITTVNFCLTKESIQRTWTPEEVFKPIQQDNSSHTEDPAVFSEPPLYQQGTEGDL